MPREELPPDEWFNIKAIVGDLELTERDWAADLLAGYFCRASAPWKQATRRRASTGLGCGEFGVRVKLSNRVVSFEDDACIVDEDVKMVRERRNKMDCLPNAFRIGDVERNECRRRAGFP